MIEPLDRFRRDYTLFQFTTRRLRNFIDSNHLLVRIDEQLDFAKLVAPLEDYCCPDFGRPTIHPEVMVRALLIGSEYNIASFRRLCSAISENIAYQPVSKVDSRLGVKTLERSWYGNLEHVPSRHGSGPEVIVATHLDELLPSDHPARFVAEFVDALDREDWAELRLAIDGDALGAPAYHPRALLSVWLYGFMTGARSSRKFEAACRDQIPYLWLTGWLRPDYNTQ